jgi:chromosome segregation ATPase
MSEAAFKHSEKEYNMSRRTGLFSISLLILVVLGLSSFIAVKAFTGTVEQPVQADQTLQALLNEVRELRLAIQRANLKTYHAQVTTERMKLQQQRVDHLMAQLDGARNQIAATRKDIAQKLASLKGNDVGLAQETKAEERADRERYSQSLKTELEELTRKEQNEQALESQLNGQLQLEQLKLNEYNERLDKLERELEAQLSDEKSQQGAKRPGEKLK